MATAQQYAEWIVSNQDKKGSDEYNTVAQAYKEARAISAQQTQPEQQPQEQPEQGFLDNVGNALSKRGEKFADDMQGVGNDLLTVNPLQTLAAGQQGITRIGGALAGAGADIIGEGISSIADTITPEFIQEGAKDALKYVADSPVGSAAKSVAEIYAGFRNKNPELAQTIADTANMGLMLTPAKLKVKTPTLKGVELGQKKLLESAIPSVKQLKKEAGDIYARLDNSSSRVGGSKLDNLGYQTRQKLVKEGYDKDLYPQLSTVLNRLNEAKGKKLTIGEIQNLRKLTDAPLNSLNKSEARLGGIVKDNIDDFIESLSPKDFIGDVPKNIGADLKDARQLWRRSKALQTLEETFSKADIQASGLENGIRTQFRSILNSNKKSKGFKPEELKAMRHAVKGGRLENYAKALGKFGFSEGQASSMLLSSLGVAGGAAVGGAGGAVLVPAIGQLSKSLAQKLTRKNFAGVNKIVAAGKEGDDIIKAYMQAVPKPERKLEDLTQLLLRPDVNLKKIQAMIPKKETPQSTMIANALYLATMAQREQGGE